MYKQRCSVLTLNVYASSRDTEEGTSSVIETSVKFENLLLNVEYTVHTFTSGVKSIPLGVMAEYDVPGRRPWRPDGLSGAEVASLRLPRRAAGLLLSPASRMVANMVQSLLVAGK